MHVEFRSHFLGEKVRLMGWEIRYAENIGCYCTKFSCLADHVPGNCVPPGLQLIKQTQI
jgi:hypothetical protein